MCNDSEVLVLLNNLFGENTSAWRDAVRDGVTDCQSLNKSGFGLGSSDHDKMPWLWEVGVDTYAFLTPVILVWGIFGNSMSLRVFTSKFMKRLSSSYYLVALSAAHLVVLLSYVLLDWLNRGLPRWPGGHRVAVVNLNGVCHLFLYLSYTSRLLAVWLVVLFTMERFVVVFIPSHRRRICSQQTAKRLILLLMILVGLLCSYKPLLSGVYTADDTLPNVEVCTRNKKFNHLIFVLDTIYVLCITAIPSAIILAMNLPILRRLLRKQADTPGTKLVFRENRLRLELTIILLTISSCFICLNLPYFALWCQQFWKSTQIAPLTYQLDEVTGQLNITRTLSYINYCSNFFLYCMTGAYYRREIKSLFRYYFKRSQSESQDTDNIQL